MSDKTKTTVIGGRRLERDVAGAISELLAVIHRDGGQHVERVGLVKACVDGIDRINVERQVIAEAEVAAAVKAGKG